MQEVHLTTCCLCSQSTFSLRPELPAHQHVSLRMELFKAILRFSNGPKLVLTRLCVAMVMYAFHALPEVWPNALVSIVQTLRGASQQVRMDRRKGSGMEQRRGGGGEGKCLRESDTITIHVDEENVCKFTYITGEGAKDDNVKNMSHFSSPLFSFFFTRVTQQLLYLST